MKFPRPEVSNDIANRENMVYEKEKDCYCSQEKPLSHRHKGKEDGNRVCFNENTLLLRGSVQIVL